MYGLELKCPNSRTLKAWTLMARLPWLIRTRCFESDSLRKQIFREVFFFQFYHLIVCCVYSLESPHRGDSNEHTQHTITMKTIEKISINNHHLFSDLAPWLTLSGSNYPYLEQISMAPKMLEPLRFECSVI